MDAIATLEERKKIRTWRNMNEHDIDYLMGQGNQQKEFIKTIKVKEYSFKTHAFATIIYGDANLFLVGEIEIGMLLEKFKNNLPSICEKTRQVFEELI